MTSQSIKKLLSLAQYLLFEKQAIFRNSNTQKYLNSWQEKNKEFSMGSV